MKKTGNPTPKPKTPAVANTPAAVPETKIPVRFIGRREVERRTDLCYVSIWKLMRANKFPRARDNGGKNAWIEAEIDAWINEQPLTVLKGEQEEGPPRKQLRARGLLHQQQKAEA